MDDDPPGYSRPQLEPLMRDPIDQPVVALPSSGGREPGEPGFDAADRRVIPQVPVLRLALDGLALGSRWHPYWASPGSPIDAVDGLTGDLPCAEAQS
jgi:hypothetical protein